MKAFDYFRAELLRFRAWALAYFGLHLVVLSFFTRVVDLAQQPLAVYQALAGVYLVSGLLLGAYQMGQYRRPNAWLNLLHRPVPHRHLALALMGAAASVLALGVLAPLLVTAGWQEWMTARVLDRRHLELIGSGWLLSVCGYLMGAYALLANRRYAVASFIFLCLFGMSAAHALGAVLVQLLALAWLGAMVLASFKPDLSAPPRGVAATVAVAAPLQMAMWFALVLGSFGFELLWIMQGTHPNNPPVPIPGSAKEADNAKGRELMIAGLQASRAPEAALWKDQAAISEIYTSGAGLTDLPVRGALTNPAPLEFDDDTRRVRWVFSHDDMRFHGIALADQRPAGTLSLPGGTALPMPPLAIGGGLLVTRNAVYQYDEEAGRLLERARAPAGEEVVGLDEAGERLVLTTQRATYLYDKRDLAASDGVLAPRLRVALPGRVGRLSRIDLMELLDGMLVSFTYTRGVYKGQGEPYQAIVRAGEDGRQQLVARRALSSGYGPLYMHSGWWFSPVAFAAQRGITGWFAGYRTEADVAPRPVPRVVVALAGALMLLCLLAAAWRSRQLDLPRSARAAWILACGIVGLPALAAMALLYPRRETLA